MPEELPNPDKVAIVLAAALTPGPAANVAACIAAGLAAARAGWAGRPLVDGAGLHSVSSSHQPIAILRAEPDTMSALTLRITGTDVRQGGVISLFPAYAQTLHDCDEYWIRHHAATHANETLLGIGLAGPKQWVLRLTGNLPLWR